MQFQVQDRIAEGDLIRLMVLIVQLIISLCLTATTLSKSVHLAGTGSLNGSNFVTPNETKPEAIASVVLFSIVGGLYIVIIGAWFVCLWCMETKVQKLFKKNLARCISTAFGGLFYYIGDNLPPLVEEYAEELGCSPNCVEETQVAGTVMLAIATATYLPITVNAVFTRDKAKDDLDKDIPDDIDVPARVAVFILLAKVTDLDLVYTSIERIIPGTCDEIVRRGAWAYYATSVAIFIVVIVYAVLCSCKDTTTAEKILVVFNAVLICVFMACYILADNRLPLGCTGSLMDNRLTRDIVKVVLSAFTLIIFVYSLTIFVAWYCCKEVRQESTSTHE